MSARCAFERGCRRRRHCGPLASSGQTGLRPSRNPVRAQTASRFPVIPAKAGIQIQMTGRPLAANPSRERESVPQPGDFLWTCKESHQRNTPRGFRAWLKPNGGPFGFSRVPSFLARLGAAQTVHPCTAAPVRLPDFTLPCGRALSSPGCETRRNPRGPEEQEAWMGCLILAPAVLGTLQRVRKNWSAASSSFGSSMPLGDRRRRRAPGVSFLFVPFLWTSKEKGPGCGMGEPRSGERCAASARPGSNRYLDQGCGVAAQILLEREATCCS